MAPRDVTVITHRAEIRSALSDLYRRAIEESPRARPRANHLSAQGAEGCRPTLIDVLFLFPPRGSPVPPLPPDLCSVLLVGFRRDLDAIVEALSKGIYVYPVEDLKTDTFAEMIQLSPAACGLYVEAGRIYVGMVRRLLQAREDQRRLSRRETEVLRLLCAGYDYRDISGTLGIERKTVRNYVAVICDKLDVSDRSQAILRGL